MFPTIKPVKTCTSSSGVPDKQEIEFSKLHEPRNTSERVKQPEVTVLLIFTNIADAVAVNEYQEHSYPAPMQPLDTLGGPPKAVDPFKQGAPETISDAVAQVPTDVGLQLGDGPPPAKEIFDINKKIIKGKNCRLFLMRIGFYRGEINISDFTERKNFYPYVLVHSNKNYLIIRPL